MVFAFIVCCSVASMREMPLLRLMSLLGQEEHNMSHNLCRCEVFRCDAMYRIIGIQKVV